MKCIVIPHYALCLLKSPSLQFQCHENLAGYIIFALEPQLLCGLKTKTRIVCGMSQNDNCLNSFLLTRMQSFTHQHRSDSLPLPFWNDGHRGQSHSEHRFLIWHNIYRTEKYMPHDSRLRLCNK